MQHDKPGSPPAESGREQPNPTEPHTTDPETVEGRGTLGREATGGLHPLFGMYAGLVKTLGDIMSAPDSADAYCADQAVPA